jgi:hypothetical protein
MDVLSSTGFRVCSFSLRLGQRKPHRLKPVLLNRECQFGSNTLYAPAASKYNTYSTCR